MKRFTTSALLAGGILAGLFGGAGVAHADLSDIWYYQQQQRAYAPHVDTSVHNSPVIIHRH